MFDLRRIVRYVFGVLLVVLTLAASACGSSRAGGSSEEISVGGQDDGAQVDLQKGQVLVITLESNPSTGYSWARQGAEDRILTQVGEAEFQAKSNLVGASGAEVLRFRAAGAGQTTLELAYRRPWEQGVAPEKTFTLQIVVK
jgi:inhibitor of cysteine peptidase